MILISPDFGFKENGKSSGKPSANVNVISPFGPESLSLALSLYTNSPTFVSSGITEGRLNSSLVKTGALSLTSSIVTL